MNEDVPEEVVIYEEWGKLEAYPGIEVSSFGRVFSITRMHYLSPFKTSSGRHQIKYREGGTCQYLMVHRLMHEIFNPLDYHPELSVDHIDGNLDNNYADNLITGERHARSRNK